MLQAQRACQRHGVIFGLHGRRRRMQTPHFAMLCPLSRRERHELAHALQLDGGVGEEELDIKPPVEVLAEKGAVEQVGEPAVGVVVAELVAW